MSNDKPAPAPSERCAHGDCERTEGHPIHDEEYERGGHDFVAHAPTPAAEWERALRHCPACGITERGPGTIHRQGCRLAAPAPGVVQP